MFQSNDIIILKITREGLFFSPRDFLPVRDIALQLATTTEVEHFEDRFQWLLAEVMNFDTGILKCKILEYNPYNKNAFNNQSYDVSIVKQLLLSSGDTGKILNLAKRKTQKRESTTRAKPEVIKESRVEEPVVKQKSPKPTNRKIIIEKSISFEFPFIKVKFIDGYAIIRERFYFNDLHKSIDLEIEIKNGFIKKGFGSIKNYFINFLKIKNITVEARVKIQNEEVLILEAQSPDIKKIGPGLIDEVKYRYIRKELLSANDDFDIYTVDELFDETGESGVGPGTFNIDDANFIDDVIKIKSPKHSKQIEYLSALHKHNIIKLRVVKKPFSFLFFLENGDNQFFIWETLFGTDGTYLWLFMKNPGEASDYKSALKDNLDSIKDEISKIQSQGRIRYLKNRPENFRRIFHDYNEKDGFETWKNAINELVLIPA
ncbi:MAG: hypothetical protein B6D64_09165 [Bacteroidetes bacterium 4484_276]|nr:MAG: hypothetical protein B6D64_09165 [Bacteroidetes bacterium 4484_276]